jgi:hypothetical protein
LIEVTSPNGSRASGGDRGHRVLAWVIATVDVNVQQGIVSFWAEAHPIKIVALLDQASWEGVSRFGEPIRGIARIRMGSVDVIEAVGKRDRNSFSSSLT